MLYKALDLLTSMTALLLGGLHTYLQYSFALTVGDPDESTATALIFSIIIAALFQAGLLLSPWTRRYSRRFRFAVALAMVPSFLILSAAAVESLVDSVVAQRRVTIVGLIFVIGSLLYVIRYFLMYSQRRERDHMAT
jgi:hypothetical protein